MLIFEWHFIKSMRLIKYLINYIIWFLAHVINDGLCYYEDHQFDETEDQETWIESKNVTLISQAEFDKIKTPEKTEKIKNPSQPPPPPLNTPSTNGAVMASEDTPRHVRYEILKFEACKRHFCIPSVKLRDT